MLGVIDVGGGLRGIYGAGVFDYCLKNNINFDYCVGISAGSANVMSYIANQMGRNYKYYTDYTFRKEYMSFDNFVKTGNYIGLDYIYTTLSGEDGEYPLDAKAIHESDKKFVVVATDAHTGEPQYFTKEDYVGDNLDFIKASCCIPIMNHPYVFQNKELIDGGLSNPIPIEKCFADGCDRVVVVLTRPVDYVRDSDMDEKLALLLQHEYPKAAECLRHRAEVYNEQLQTCKQLQEEGKVLIIAPDDIGGMKTLTKDKNEIKTLYVKGYHDAQNIQSFLEK